ncbi:alpha,alpha-trehalase [Nematocida sp. AWRm77]|nr:alpha,alpha-trehalase [Nematocida sp. AWRm77]
MYRKDLRNLSSMLLLLGRYLATDSLPDKEAVDNIQTKESPATASIVDRRDTKEYLHSFKDTQCHTNNIELLRTSGKTLKEPLFLYGAPISHTEWCLFIDMLLCVDVKDQKTIVDSIQIVDKNEVLRRYKEIEALESAETRVQKIKDLYKECYKPPKGLQNYVPRTKQTALDWRFSASIYKDMLNGILLIWPNLMKGPVYNEGGTHSLISLRHAFVVSGGRFQEMYYWDSFWMFKGLILSSREDIVKSSKSNFIEMIKRFGFIPNGSRWYYANRSQPPYFTQMLVDSKKALDAIAQNAQEQMLDANKQIKPEIQQELKDLRAAQKSKDKKTAFVFGTQIEQPKCADHTPDMSRYANAEVTDEELEYAEKEYMFWENYKSVDVQIEEDGKISTYKLAKYGVVGPHSPRPEMLRYDLEDAYMYSQFYPNRNQNEYYKDIIACTESGWDFSKRWREYHPEEKMYGFLKTNSILPVCLNSILVKNGHILSYLYAQRSRPALAKKYKEKALARAKAIDAVLWDSSHKRWRDVFLVPGPIDTEGKEDKETEKERTDTQKEVYHIKRKEDSAFYLSDLYPLFMDIVSDPSDRIFQENEQFIWMDGMFLPKTSNHVYVKRTAEENILCKDMASFSREDILKEQHRKNDQWDSDNVWPPLVHLVVEYLICSKNISRAILVSKTYLDTMDHYFKTFRSLPEKLVFSETLTGEYEVQQGFGWSNSVVQWMYHVFSTYIDGLPKE